MTKEIVSQAEDTSPLVKVFRDLSRAMKQMINRQGIGNRFKHKLVTMGMAGGGCGGCGQTQAKMNTMTPHEAEQQIDLLLEEMSDNVKNSKDVLVAAARAMTTESFRHDFAKKRLLASIAEQSEEDDMIVDMLDRVLRHENVPAPVVQFVQYLMEVCGRGSNGSTNNHGD